jgi:hypothetical protein
MKSKILGLGLGLAVSTLGVVAVPAAVAFADTPAATATPNTCYTGCTTPLTSPPTTPVPVVSVPIEPKAAPVAGGGLPFTGADISEMAAVGAGALVAGGLMVRRSRRLRQVAA